MSDRADVPAAVVDRLRSICLALPQAYEEPAWVGTRWRVRDKTFAHVMRIDAGWPPAYVRAAKTEGPADVLTFESSGAALITESYCVVAPRRLAERVDRPSSPGR